jgi:hypothetical protein
MRLPPSARRLIEDLTRGDPEARKALEVAVPVLTDPVTWWVMAAVAGDQRAVILLTLRDAIQAVAKGKPCDFCRDAAGRVILDVSHPDDDGMDGVQRSSADLSVIAFLILCPSCADLPEEERRRRKLDRVAKLQSARGDAALVPYRRPTHIGAAVGSGGPLPARPGLQKCEYCGRDIWIGGDELEEAAAMVSYACASCAASLASSGRLETCLFLRASWMHSAGSIPGWEEGHTLEHALANGRD